MRADLQHDFRVFANVDELALAAARDFAQRANRGVAEQGVFRVALSGGHTPKALFDILVKGPEFVERTPIPWTRIEIFWGDERYVPHDDPQSNFFMTREHLLKHVPVPENNIHPIPTSHNDPNVSALEYENLLRAEFRLPPDDIPEFDLVYLGLGPDGHTASLFPRTDLVGKIVRQEIPEDRLVAALWVEKFSMYRVTLLPRVFNHARCVVFLAAGNDKASILERVIKGPEDPLTLPSQLIAPVNKNLIWFLDQAAFKSLQATEK